MKLMKSKLDNICKGCVLGMLALLLLVSSSVAAPAISNKEVYVSSGFSNQILGYDGQTGAFMDGGPRLLRTTTWAYSGCIRGLAYDGHYYYIADCNDYLIDNRSDDLTGRIYIYDENGFVKRLPENPPIRWTYFPHGVATDGTKLWTTDYWGGNIYEYQIASGELLRTFSSPISDPVRLDFDGTNRTLWLTGYDNPNIYQVDLNGTIVSSFPTSGLGLNKNVALDGNGGMLVASSEGNAENGDEESIHLLRRYSINGTLLEEYSNFYTAYMAMATNINDRGSGFIQDGKLIFNSSTGKYEQRIEHYALGPTVIINLSGIPVVNQSTKDILSVDYLNFNASDPYNISITGMNDSSVVYTAGGTLKGVRKETIPINWTPQDTGQYLVEARGNTTVNNVTIVVSDSEVISPIPELSTIALMSAGLVGFLGLIRVHRRD